MIGKMRAMTSSSKQTPSATTSPKTSLSKRMLAILLALALACTGFAGMSSTAFADDAADGTVKNPPKGVVQAFVRASADVSEARKSVAGKPVNKLAELRSARVDTRETVGAVSSSVWMARFYTDGTCTIVGYIGSSSKPKVPRALTGPNGMTFMVTEVYLGLADREDDTTLANYNNSAIRTLDLSKCSMLQRVGVNLPKLKKVNMGKSKKSKLIEFVCVLTQVTDLDVTKCPNLKWLYVDNNALSKINVSKNKKLEWLSVTGNKLTSLNISKSKKLEYLYCDNNYLGSLNVTKNTKLLRIDCQYNQIKSLKLNKSKKLALLTCDHNKLSSLNLSKNKQLYSVDCSYNNITKLNISKTTRLEDLYCQNNKIKSFKINKNLWVLDCGNNNLKKLNVAKAKKLVVLDCRDNKLKKLSLAKNKNLWYVYCFNNAFTKKATKALKKWRDNNTSQCEVFM
ncbi:MAG: hypothetical protein FWG00_03510 [Coriobacteriia bacterium]|nr:hypothetical protein [Coriobacteriia bacterium]